MDKDMKRLLGKLGDMGQCISSIAKESSAYGQAMREMRELGKEMSELAKNGLAEADESEKQERVIDGDEFLGWQLSASGKIVWHNAGVDELTEVIDKPLAKLVVSAPVLMRAMIDFVNQFQEFMVVSDDVGLYMDRFKTIITDAGFKDDIA